MIQPISALTKKVSFRGNNSADTVEAAIKRKKKRMAIINASGIAIVLGAATTAIARSNTSSWKNAGYCGLGVGILSLMFLAPGFLYKSGVYTKNIDKDFFSKEKKIITETIESSVTKNNTKNAIKTMPKV